ncbi:hypothetical protein HMPREF1548_02960 [Clostridium sp. KLE 1755]|nr:hypothetical protein HMPREF1548_02960 [Clostridium sp. KLE 1755]
MRQKGIILHHTVIFFTGILTALKTIFRTAVFPAAAEYGAGLVSLSAAAAGAILIQVHGAQRAV